MTLQTRPQSLPTPAAEARLRAPEASVSCQSTTASSAQVSHVTADTDGTVWVSGAATVYIRGTITL
ncbi:hypothetical protein [Streptomyces phyllanthi]